MVLASVKTLARSAFLPTWPHRWLSRAQLSKISPKGSLRQLRGVYDPFGLPPMRATWAAITILGTSGVDIMETDILTLQHDSARAQRHIKEQLDGLNRAERNIARLVEEVVGLRGEVKRLQSLEREVRELRALVGTRPEPGVLYELSPGHEREVTVTTAGDAEPEAQIASL